MSTSSGKTFNCPIHGHLELSPLSVKVIDTPQFQRLRDISQLGGVYYVFPGAASKRFEHCIGVAYLARYFIDKLAAQQPELGISIVDILCVELAGLCHDLGHGPFSHLFDAKVLPQLGVRNFVHEHASIGILDVLISENGLMPEFRRYGLDDNDIHFIKELILGDVHEAPEGFQWRGRGNKTFLYDIVANKRNGIDVDKFDYFARDCHVLGVSKSFDCLRLMKFARVHAVQRNGEENLEICFHKKEVWNLFELFHTRYALHKRAYQHKVSACVELLIAEAMIRAAPFIVVPGRDRAPRNLAQCADDMHAYWRLGEYILKEIENSMRPELQPARDAVERLRRRDLMCCANEVLLDNRLSTSRNLNSDQIKRELLALKSDIDGSSCPTPTRKSESEPASTRRALVSNIAENDLFVAIIKLGYGKGGSDPVTELTTFYAPVKDAVDSSNDSAWEIGALPSDSVSRLLPREFQETYIRVYCRYKHQVPGAKLLFDQWCESNSIRVSSFPTRGKRLREDSPSDNDDEEYRKYHNLTFASSPSYLI